MKIPKVTHRKVNVAAIAVLVLTSMTVLPGLAPTASAEEPMCFDTGNEEAFIYISLCVEVSEPQPVEDLPGPRSVQFRAPVSLEPEFGENVCIVGDVCTDAPKHVTNWISIGWDNMEVEFDRLINVSRANVTDTTIQVDQEQLEQVVCGAVPPVCTEIEGMIRDVIGAVEVIRPASTSGDAIDGVLLMAEDGPSIYIGFGN